MPKTDASVRLTSAKTRRALLAGVVSVLVVLVAVAVALVDRQVRTGGSVRWRADLPTRWVQVIPLGDRAYLYEAQRGFRVLDRTTGRELFSVGGVRTVGDVASDGSIVLTSRAAGEYYAANGKRRWRIEGKAWENALGVDEPTSPRVAAVDDGVVVFRSCDDVCRYAGIDSTGAVRWRWSATGHLYINEQIPYPGASVGGPAPRVVVDQNGESIGDGELVTRAAVDGKLLDRRNAAAQPGGPSDAPSGVGVVGDLAVFTGRDSAGCTVTGMRDGRRVWRATRLPCGAPGASLVPTILTAHRMYAETESGSSVTVDLRDGKWRTLKKVAFSVSDIRQHTIGIPGDDVVVYRKGNELTTVDAGSGRRLWSYDSPGDEPPGVAVGSGAVVLLGRPGGFNPLIPKDVRDDGYLVTVLDPRTGTESGSMVSLRGVATSAPFGSDAALVVTEDEPEATLVGD